MSVPERAAKGIVDVEDNNKALLAVLDLVRKTLLLIMTHWSYFCTCESVRALQID